MGSCELNGPPNRSLRAENRPEHFSRARGRSAAASPRTHSVSAFPARADSADETDVSVALFPANPRHVRMNPFILCPGGPNGSSDAQIELKEQIWIWRDDRNALSEGRVLGQDDRKWRAVVRRGKLIFGSLSSVPGER